MPEGIPSEDIVAQLEIGTVVEGVHPRTGESEEQVFVSLNRSGDKVMLGNMKGSPRSVPIEDFIALNHEHLDFSGDDAVGEAQVEISKE